MTLLLAVVLIACAYMAVSGYIARRLHPTHYSEFVSDSSLEFGVPPSVVYAVIKTESSFREGVTSPAGAMGLMQLTPDTFDWLRWKTGEVMATDALFTPEVNIRYGTMLLAILYEEFGSWDTVFAAYNAGLNRVRLWLANPDYSDGVSLTDIPYSETKNYVKKVGAAVSEYRRLYGFE